MAKCPVPECQTTLNAQNIRQADLDKVSICNTCHAAYRACEKTVYFKPYVKKSLFPFPGAERRKVMGFRKQTNYGLRYSEPLTRPNKEVDEIVTESHAAPAGEQCASNEHASDEEESSGDVERVDVKVEEVEVTVSNGSLQGGERPTSRKRLRMEGNVNKIEAAADKFDQLEAERDQLADDNKRLLEENRLLRVKNKRLRNTLQQCRDALANL